MDLQHISQSEKIYTLESTGSMKRNVDFFISDNKIWQENEINKIIRKDKLIMAAYGVGFAVTTAVMVCEGLFGSSAVWFMFKSVGKRFLFSIFEFEAENWL